MRISILDLAPIPIGQNASDAFQRTLELAQSAEKWGYHRYWLAEHHNMQGIASSAPVVLMAHLAGHTRKIRIGSGGVMLPNHAPLIVAEQFGTLESLFPGRIDLGLGRAPGTDPFTRRALRRETSPQDFPDQLAELRSYFEGPEARQVRAIPGSGLKIPIWLLGSSLWSAQLAGHLGLPYAFASHFAPELLMEALETYRRLFQPSEDLKEPYAIAGLQVVAAPTDQEAEFLATTIDMRFLSLVRGEPLLLRPPVSPSEIPWTELEKAQVGKKMGGAIRGSQQTVERRLREFIAKTGVQELMITGDLFDQKQRLRSFEMIAQAKLL